MRTGLGHELLKIPPEKHPTSRVYRNVPQMSLLPTLKQLCRRKNHPQFHQSTPGNTEVERFNLASCRKQYQIYAPKLHEPSR